ncbi:hypothetical protein [Actinomadura violacea]|uniref:Uncharacterized protein n=1 Tax=Actinomadura violacea TaxID=2819934 RepID=A0ABS3RXW8_9ACTN|nr:hypothetical protein [Actinomadura violacea]MBO2461609.1 hypothetical protein [Actinomadura violacea]
MYQPTALIVWTPAEPGDERFGFSYGSFTDADEAAREADKLRAAGRTVELVTDPEQARVRYREVVDAARAAYKAKQEAAVRRANTPVLGKGATHAMPQDRMPFVVTAISPSGAKVALEALRTVGGHTGHKPAYHVGPWPVWDHEYSDAELETMRYEGPELRQYAHRRKDGRYYMDGQRVYFGGARYRRSYAD